ncbi:hypothetical protein [Mycolicibacterium doricum]|uniref:hypothetical protein n=1 Tax=Mycolicibacterium doricum TaxID=126673 RepID=UPI001056B12E|nr:hypothetical protein [Mycolicibacterium doricum]MCV7266696.1 hypothetical protein [Mycolicibacterium doricum]
MDSFLAVLGVRALIRLSPSGTQAFQIRQTEARPSDSWQNLADSRSLSLNIRWQNVSGHNPQFRTKLRGSGIQRTSQVVVSDGLLTVTEDADVAVMVGADGSDETKTLPV